MKAEKRTHKTQIVSVSLTVAIIALFLMLSGAAYADSLLPTEGGGLGDIYSSEKACKVGDIVTVVFEENTLSTQLAKGSVKSTYNNGVNSGSGLLNFFNGLGMSGGQQTDVESKTTQGNTLTATMTARVEEVLPNGYLVILGTKQIEVNHENQKLTVKGIVRPRDITSGNTVPSTKVGNMEAKVNGLPISRSAAKPRGGVIRWVWGLLF
ncbi:MAG: flagellar basal body L-ring protein FlgH [Firmicutes bacterium]|nr:flagellar basal body L-ring protein FlgH [Bacillota bacterium]